MNQEKYSIELPAEQHQKLLDFAENAMVTIPDAIKLLMDSALKAVKAAERKKELPYQRQRRRILKKIISGDSTMRALHFGHDFITPPTGREASTLYQFFEIADEALWESSQSGEKN